MQTFGHWCPDCWQQLPQIENFDCRTLPSQRQGALGFHFELEPEFCKQLTSTNCGFGSVLLLPGQLTISTATQYFAFKLFSGCNCSDQFIWRRNQFISAQTAVLGITTRLFQEILHLTTFLHDCRPQSTNCGIGSEYLPGLSIVSRRHGGFQSPLICADRFIAAILRILQYFFGHCALGVPTYCRVGSCYRLTGQLVHPLHTTGLGTPTDCPIQGFIFVSSREGWAPFFWLAWWSLPQEPTDLFESEEVTTTSLRGWTHHCGLTWTVFSFVWHWIHFSWWRFQFFWIGLALLLAKGALELHWLYSQFCIIGGSFWIASEQANSAVTTSCSNGGTHTQRGTSGPKSRRHPYKSCTRQGYWLLSLLCIFMTLWQGGWGEGCGQAMMAAEVQNATHAHLDMVTKLHGLQPQACFGTSFEPETARKRQNKVVKRSLQRAYRRSLQQGMAWYKGKLFCTADFERMGCAYPSQRAQPTGHVQWDTDLHRCNQHHAAKRRLSVWQWNCSCLSTPKLDEVKAWLTLNQIDVAALVETRWTYDANWTDGHWHMIHSGAGEHRGKGIMLLISTRLCAASQIQWQLQDSGRLVHVRLNLQPRSFQPTASCRQARAKWWTLLETVLAGLPSRNGLILFGDFNCSLGASGQNIGTGSFRWRGSLCTGLIHPDAARFQQILRHFALNVLNSWSSALGPTFVHGSQANRLDYFCVRQPYADGTARQVRYLWDSPFLHQTDYGHVPMMCTLAKHWIPSFSQHRIQRVTLQQRQVSGQSYLAQDSDWLRFVACTQTQIATHFARDDLTADEFMETLHRDVLQQFCEHFPAGKHKRSPAAWQTALPTLLTKWEHRRCMQRLGMGTLKNLFKGWYHATKYCSLRRAHKKLAYQTRKNLFYDVVAQAEAAARRHDTHKLFQLINRYAPKQPKKQIQLRKDDGQMASPVESAALLNQFVANTWAGPDRLHLRFDSAPGVPFTVQQLERALSLIPSSKAVAKPFSPGTVWRQHASFLAPLLHAKLTVWWASNPPKIPDSWRHGWLFMIPKPSKPPVSLKI